MPEPVVWTMAWSDVDDALMAHLVRYVVMARGEQGCRNIDLCASATVPGRVVVLEKWADAASQRAHLDGEALVALATAARELGAARPDMDLLDSVSVYDVE